jgi:hypothetical protein
VRQLLAGLIRTFNGKPGEVVHLFVLSGSICELSLAGEAVGKSGTGFPAREKRFKRT